MVTLFRKLVDNFLHDEMAAKRWIRGGLNACASVLGQVIIDPTWSTWTVKQWMVHLVPSAIGFAAGAVTAGDKTTPEKVQKAIDFGVEVR